MLAWLGGATTTDELLQEIARHPLHERRIDPSVGRLPRFPRGDRARKIAAAILAQKENVGGAFSDIEQVGGDRRGRCDRPRPADPRRLRAGSAGSARTGHRRDAAAANGDPLLRTVCPATVAMDDAPACHTGRAVARPPPRFAHKLGADALGDHVGECGRRPHHRHREGPVAPVRDAGRRRTRGVARRSFPAQVTGGSISINRPATTRTDLGTSRIAGAPGHDRDLDCPRWRSRDEDQHADGRSHAARARLPRSLDERDAMVETLISGGESRRPRRGDRPRPRAPRRYRRHLRHQVGRHRPDRGVRRSSRRRRARHRGTRVTHEHHRR